MHAICFGPVDILAFVSLPCSSLVSLRQCVQLCGSRDTVCSNTLLKQWCVCSFERSVSAVMRGSHDMESKDTSPNILVIVSKIHTGSLFDVELIVRLHHSVKCERGSPTTLNQKIRELNIQKCATP